MTSYRMQLLRGIWPASLAQLAVTAWIAITLSWSAELGRPSDHIPWIRRALSMALQRDMSGWWAYWQRLSQLQLQGTWLLHVAVPIIAAAVVTVSCLILYCSRATERHIDGPLPLGGKTALRHARAAYRREWHQGAEPGIHVHQHIRISTARELGNLLISGAQGNGKSVILKPAANEVVERGDRCLIYDQKSEYTPLFFVPERAVLLNPADDRSSVWDIADDCRSDEQALLIAEQLVEITGREPIWDQGARLILAGSMISLTRRYGRHWGWPELRYTLDLPEGDLRELLNRYYPPAARLVAEESITSASFLMNITAKLGWTATLARAWPDRCRRPFSVNRWIADPTAAQIIIVPNSAEYSSISAPLCSALVSLMTAKILALPDSNLRKIWFLLDELANLPKSTSLLKWLSLGRSKGARTMAGFQSMSQLRELYGSEGAETLLSLFHTVVSVRCGQAGGSAEAVSKSFGQRIVERLDMTDNGQTHSTRWQRNTESVVRVDQLTQLPQPNAQGVTGYLSVAGWNAVYRLAWPYSQLPKIAADYEPAAWTKLMSDPEERARTDKRRRLGRRD